MALLTKDRIGGALVVVAAVVGLVLVFGTEGSEGEEEEAGGGTPETSQVEEGPAPGQGSVPGQPGPPAPPGQPADGDGDDDDG